MTESSPAHPGAQVPDVVQPGPDEPHSPTPARRSAVLRLLGIAAAFAVLLTVLQVAPAAGAALCLVAVVAVVPLGGDRASTRLVSCIVLALGLLALALALGDTFDFRVLSLRRLQLAFVAAATVAAAFAAGCVLRGRRVPWARPDASLVPLVVVTAVGWFSAGYPAHDVALGHAVGGLMSIGFDHQSHFSIFAYLYEQQGVWLPGPPESASMFLGYPPLAGALGAALATLASPERLNPSELVGPYIQTSSAMFGLSAGLMAWTAAEAGRGITIAARQTLRAGAVAVASGLAVGGYVVLGPASALFDYGFSNFVLAVSIATAASYLALADAQRAPAQAAATAVAAATAMGLLWTPLVVLLVPAGLTVIVRIIRRRSWKSLAVTLALAGAGLWVVTWQVHQMVPDGPAAMSFAQALASLGGGEPAVPLPYLVIVPLLGLVALAVARTRPDPAWLAPWAAPGAAAFLSLAFVLNSIRLGFAFVDSYFVTKAMWCLYLCMLPLIGTLVAGAMLTVLRHLSERDLAHGRAPQAVRTRRGLVGALAVALVWVSTPTEDTSRGPYEYYALPVGGQAVFDRWQDFRSADGGEAVVGAQAVTSRRPASLSIVWKGRDLLTNRWLASLRGNLTLQHDVIYRALAETPDARAARDVLAQALEADPALDLVVVTSSPANDDLLRSLVQQFPGRVELSPV